MFYIYENQKRKDGVVNVQPPVGRETIENAMSYYYDRCSKMAATDLFVRVAVMICDEDLRVIDHKILEKHVEEVAEPIAE